MKTLEELSDQELSEAFAVEVASWADPITLYAWSDRKARSKPIQFYKTRPSEGRWVPLGDYGTYVDETGIKIQYGEPFKIHRDIPSYATDANAVLPWLEKCAGYELSRERSGYHRASVIMERPGSWFYAVGDTFARAAVIALLKAQRATP